MADQLERLSAALADRYSVERELGQGGMATVYLAEDLRHHRKVALKVLKPEIAATLGAGRFAREIEVAARLQHPNILPLLDSGEADGFLFYVMPYVEGESLRDRLARGGELPIQDAVRILMEVADALSEAHAHGVVHRDIKPDNVMLRGRHALVTDFGVAKAVTAATGQQLLTSTGVALGTPTYMAPEQATADPHQDHRVDIYALGVLGYELLTGRAPFSATTAQEMLAAHVIAEPEPLEKHRATVPPALTQIILKCLAKRPADRWQTAEEVLTHLEPLATPSGGTTPTQTAPIEAVKSRRRTLTAAAGAGTVAALAVAALAYQFLRSKPLNITVSDFTQVTNAPGVEFQQALSPDGGEVAYAAGTVRVPHIEMRSTARGSGGEVRLSDESFVRAWLPKWSPDGQFVRFFGCRPGEFRFNGPCTWSEVGRLGGPARPATLPERAKGVFALAWSPDGARAAFFVSETLLVVSVGDSIAPRRVAVHPGLTEGPHSPAWSPDGKMIAYVNGNVNWVSNGNQFGSSIWIVSAGGGRPAQITSDDHLNASPVWLDGRHILFVSDRDGARGVYVVEIGPRGARGMPRLVPGVADPHSISYASGPRQLAWSRFTFRQNIWAYPLSRAAPVSIRSGVRVTTGNEVTEGGDVSPDGKWLVFDSRVGGNVSLYRMPMAGGERVPLAQAPWNGNLPRWSSDGTEIAFYGDVGRPGAPSIQVLVMPAGGGRPAILTRAPGVNRWPEWSPDGLHITFFSSLPSTNEVWLLSRDSVRGPWYHEALLVESAESHSWAPDGSGVLCTWNDGSFGVVSVRGHVLWRRNLQSTTGLVSWDLLQYARDGHTIYTQGRHRDGRSGIWAIPAAGGEARLVVAADDPALVFYGAVTVSGDRILARVAEYESDIWVAKLNY